MAEEVTGAGEAAGTPEVIGYCVKCKAKQPMQNAEKVDMPAKGGGTRPAMKGVCPVCSTGMFRILPKSEA